MTPGLSLLNLSTVVDKESSFSNGSSWSPESTTNNNAAGKNFSQFIKEASNSSRLTDSSIPESSPESSTGTSGYSNEALNQQELISLMRQGEALPEETAARAVEWARPVPLEPNYSDQGIGAIDDLIAHSDSLQYPHLAVNEVSQITAEFPVTVDSDSVIGLTVGQAAFQESDAQYGSFMAAFTGPVKVAQTSGLELSIGPAQLEANQDQSPMPRFLADMNYLVGLEDFYSSDQTIAVENLLANAAANLSGSDYAIEDLQQGSINPSELAMVLGSVDLSQSTAAELGITFAGSVELNLANGYTSSDELTLTSMREAIQSGLNQSLPSNSMDSELLSSTIPGLDTRENLPGPSDTQSTPSAFLPGSALLQELANREIKASTSSQSTSSNASLNALRHGDSAEGEITSLSKTVNSQVNGAQMNLEHPAKLLTGAAGENSFDMSDVTEVDLTGELFNADESLADLDGELDSFVNNNALKLLQASSNTPAISPLSTAAHLDIKPGLSPLAQLSIPQSVNTASWGSEVSDKVMWMAAQGISEAEIQLDPPELGPLQARVTVHQDQAQVVFTSQSAQVRDALDQQATRLREMFAGEGLDLTDVDVSDQQTQDRQDQDETDHNRGAVPNNESVAAHSEQVVSPAMSQFLVDQYV